jgi:hypothetical protein
MEIDISSKDVSLAVLRFLDSTNLSTIPGKLAAAGDDRSKSGYAKRGTLSDFDAIAAGVGTGNQLSALGQRILPRLPTRRPTRARGPQPWP